ncbi:unnamed protein product [Durusdinium trenchii]|uniref:Uncharacterized protein n=1 Tax=Durusdinium trenchii TaxID=1381693 RepID=A0ABP0P1B3_9DINO
MVLDYRRPRQDKTEVEWLSSYFKFILEHDAKNYQGRWGADERAGGPRGRVRCRSALDLFALWALANCFLRLSRRRIAGVGGPGHGSIGLEDIALRIWRPWLYWVGGHSSQNLEATPLDASLPKGVRESFGVR